MGAIEYPSQYNIGLDLRVCPVFRPQIAGDLPDVRAVRSPPGWFAVPPDPVHIERKRLSAESALASAASATASRS
jgi:hypothetical protein